MGRESLTIGEQERAKILHAEGRTFNHIAGALGRSPHTIKRFLIAPGVTEQVSDTKKELADLYQAMAKRTLEAVCEEDIKKASLLQKLTASGIAIDKALLLRGEMPGIDVKILIQLVEAVREIRDASDKESLRGSFAPKLHGDDI